MVDYDPAVEAELCPDEGLRNRLLRYRAGVMEHKLERAVSTRFLKDAYKMQAQHGWDTEKVDGALFRGWRDDEVAKVKNYRSN